MTLYQELVEVNYITVPVHVHVQMKHYRAKPLAQLSKYLQDDMKHAVMKVELE